MITDLIEIKLISFKKGRGLVAKNYISKGSIIEEAPVILISDREYESIKGTVIDNYVFDWNDPNDSSEYKSAVAMSICEMINHSYAPNLAYEKDFKNQRIKFYAIEDIFPGDELTMNYNGISDDCSPLWFELEEY